MPVPDDAVQPSRSMVHPLACCRQIKDLPLLWGQDVGDRAVMRLSAASGPLGSPDDLTGVAVTLQVSG